MLNKAQVHQEMVFIVPRWYDMEHSQDKILIKWKLWESTNISGLEAKVAPAKVNYHLFWQCPFDRHGMWLWRYRRDKKAKSRSGPWILQWEKFWGHFHKKSFWVPWKMVKAWLPSLELSIASPRIPQSRQISLFLFSPLAQDSKMPQGS